MLLLLGVKGGLALGLSYGVLRTYELYLIVSLLARNNCEVALLITVPSLLLLVNAGLLAPSAIACMLLSSVLAYAYLLFVEYRSVELTRIREHTYHWQLD